MVDKASSDLWWKDAVEKLAVPIDIAGHGFRWFRVASDPTQTPG